MEGLHITTQDWPDQPDIRQTSALTLFQDVETVPTELSSPEAELGIG